MGDISAEAVPGEGATFCFALEASRPCAASGPILLAEGNLPRLDRHEVLRRIRADAHTRMLPVVILSASAEVVVEARGPHGPCSGG
ncbi:response regulator [Myxococcus xanthus]|uniref:hypothetical protein n=1 Tax=Myxococcus xanthus TaxID=34 RepID=UPI001CEDAF64|nr:hypothetical protein [Myxococcus xanthus]